MHRMSQHLFFSARFMIILVESFLLVLINQILIMLQVFKTRAKSLLEITVLL